MNKDEMTRQLGMNPSTARGRLVKLIMFDMMKRLDEDRCFKCGVAIEDIDHLSIEHKIPWLHNGSGLFWDLNNIAFSHLACNKPNRPWLLGLNNPATVAQDKLLDEGLKACTRCKRKLPISSFTSANTRRSGLQSFCKTCHNEHRKPLRRKSYGPIAQR